MLEIKNTLECYKEFPGPILLLSSPGTGKTHQLTHRIKYLINDLAVDPNEITILTFTNEAAKYMRQILNSSELIQHTESHLERIWTIHKLGNQIIGMRPELCGLDNKYQVLSNNEIREIILQDAASIAGFGRNEWVKTNLCRLRGTCIKTDENKCIICDSYKDILRKCSLIDFDDQIFLACEILKKDSDVKAYWKEKTRYLLIDEFQDINKAQFELIQLLAEDQEDGLFVVGDDDQSIYSFRGGTQEFIQNFETYFGKSAKCGMLTHNWRCNKNILEGSLAIIKNKFEKRVAKKELTYQNDCDNKIQYYDVPSDKFEAYIISKIVKEKIKTNSVIIIIPNEFYLQTLTRELNKNEIDYIYRHKPNKDGLQRFLNLDNWINNKNKNHVLRYLIELAITNYDDLTNLCKGGGITEKRINASTYVASMWKSVTKRKTLFKVLEETSQDSTSFSSRLYQIFINLIELLESDGGKRSSIEPFLQQCGLILAPGKSATGLLKDIKKWKNNLFESRADSLSNPINIYNIYSSKGLEADIVFIIGLSDKEIPASTKDITEQSRLMYVAMTRAKNELHLFSARRRPGNITFAFQSYMMKQSPFITLIPAENKEVHYIRTSK